MLRTESFVAESKAVNEKKYLGKVDGDAYVYRALYKYTGSLLTAPRDKFILNSLKISSTRLGRGSTTPSSREASFILSGTSDE